MKKFYENGLCFECKRCSRCCRHSGYVFLSENDIEQLSVALKLSGETFIKNHCIVVAVNGETRISLDERTNGDCLFYDDEIKGCCVYEHRPLQCKLYPFWHSMVMNESEWKAEKKTCPGLDCGKYYSADEIEERLVQRRLDPIIKF